MAMPPHKVAPHDEWLAARKALLEKEKAFNKLRDELSAERRQLPWERVEKAYSFEGKDGKVSLSDLFDGRGQLLVYHFMLGPSSEEGCKSCSFWADNFNGIEPHLRARDTAFAFVSRAPYPKLAAFQKRMGWGFRWVSSHESEFNRDYGVTFDEAERKSNRANYNYALGSFPADEAPGMSVFAKDDAGAIFHTYSTYARGLDMLNGAYHCLDLTPKGRDEKSLSYSMAWLRHRDKYE